MAEDTVGTFGEQIGELIRGLFQSEVQAFKTGVEAEVGAVQRDIATVRDLFRNVSGWLTSPETQEGLGLVGSGLTFDRGRVQQAFGAGLAKGLRPGTVAPSGVVTAPVAKLPSTVPAQNIHALLVSMLTASERRLFERLDPQAAEGYLAGKEQQLRFRLALAQKQRLEGGQAVEPERLRGPPGPGFRAAGAQDEMSFEDFLAQLLGGAGGGGGAGAGRQYVPPDRDAVRDTARSLAIALIGRADDTLTEELVGIYMDADRRRVEGLEPVEPLQAVKERLRSTPEYGRIHRLRPQGIAEEDWLNLYRSLLLRAGLPVTTLDKLTVGFATAGVNPASTTAEGFGIRRLTEGGTVTPDLKGRMGQIGNALGRLVR